jgi:hypothetical protein
MTVKKETISIDKIYFKRAITPNDNLDALIAHMKSYGQTMPLILDADYNLIDGLRRYFAAVNNGNKEIDVVICPTLEDTCQWLSKTVKEGTLAREPYALRLYQIFTDTYKQQQERGARIRAKRVGKPRNTSVGEKRSRAMLNEAIGSGPGEAKLAQSTFMYTKFFELADDPDWGPALKVIREKLEANELTIYAARGAMDRLFNSDLGGNIVNLNEQRNALATALNQLAGTTKALAHIGEINPEIEMAELTRYIKGFEDSRRNLTAFISSLRKRVTTP